MTCSNILFIFMLILWTPKFGVTKINLKNDLDKSLSAPDQKMFCRVFQLTYNFLQNIFGKLKKLSGIGQAQKTSISVFV